MDDGAGGGTTVGVDRRRFTRAPELPDVLVGRTELERRLGPDTCAAWSLVVGPPGAGKSTLVRAWLQSRTEPWAWINVGSRSFRRSGVAGSVVRAVQDMADDRLLDTLDDLDMGIASGAAILGHLTEELSADGPSLVLVIDDAHLLVDDDWTALRPLLDETPRRLHVVVISRSEPPIPLGREKATGRVTVVRGADLAFGPTDTAALVEKVMGATDPAIVVPLHERTEGWVAGVRLAALAIRDGADPQRLLDAMAERESTVAEFLVEEVLDHRSDDEQRALRSLAVLDTVESGLGDAVAGRPGTAALLGALADDGTFVQRLEGGGELFRFHALLGDVLRYELERIDPAAFRAAHRRAAEWLIDHDRAIDAIEHLLAADDGAQAHEILVRNFHPVYRGRHRPTIDRWLLAMPDHVIAETIERAVDHLVALALVAHPAATLWWWYCFEHVPPDDDWLVSRLDAVLAIGHAVNGRLDEMRSCAQRSEDRRPSDRVEPIVEILASWDARLGALLDDPHRAVATARRLQEMTRELLADESVLSVLAGTLAAAGDHEAAGAVARRALERWQEAGEPELPAMVDSLVVLAAGARQAGRFDDADRFLEAAEAIIPRRGARPSVLTAIVGAERARFVRARGDDSWRMSLRTLEEDLRTGPPTPFVAWVCDVRRELEAGAERGPVVRRDPADGLEEGLTPREQEVLRLLASHRSLPEIGTELFISRHTVKSHVVHIYRKLGVNGRSEAVAAARARGLLD